MRDVAVKDPTAAIHRIIVRSPIIDSSLRMKAAISVSLFIIMTFE